LVADGELHWSIVEHPLHQEKGIRLARLAPDAPRRARLPEMVWRHNSLHISISGGPLTISLNVVARSGHVLEIFENRTLSNPDKIAQNLQNVVVNNRTDFANTSKVVVKNGHTENWQKKCEK
jgi:hypothetical protein